MSEFEILARKIEAEEPLTELETMKLKELVVSNWHNEFRMTMLHLACVYGQIKTFKTLLSLGIKVDTKNSRGQTALHSALTLPIHADEAQKDNKEIMASVLIAHTPALLTVADNDGNCAMHNMALHGFNTLLKEAISTTPLLIKTANSQTHYPIHIAILNDQIEAATNLLAIAECALLADSKGQNALHYAAQYGSEEMIKLCLESSKDNNSQDSEEKTALILAVENDRLEAAKLLLAEEVEVDKVDSMGRHVLHYAVENGDYEMIKLLLNHAGDLNINLEDAHGDTPLKLLDEGLTNAADIKNLLLEYGATNGPSSSLT